MKGKTLALKVMGMKPGEWGAEEKLAIVMEGLKEKKPVAGIFREHQMSQTLYDRWRDKFLEGGKKALVNGASEDNVYKAEIEKLFRRLLGSRRFRLRY